MRGRNFSRKVPPPHPHLKSFQTERDGRLFYMRSVWLGVFSLVGDEKTEIFDIRSAFFTENALFYLHCSICVSV